jgi:hypothetical protein
MSTPELVRLIKENYVKFDRFVGNHFYYKIYNESDGNVYTYPIPIEDVGYVAMLNVDRAGVHLRWIKRASEAGKLLPRK